MAINTLEFAEKFTGVLDKILVETTKTGFMVDNAFRAKFVGAKTVKIPNIEMSALGDYDRDTGFIRGAVTVTNSAYTLTQDRARTFSIDREDMDETGVAELAGSVMSEFVRTKVVPETDAYVLSKLAGIAMNEEKNHVLALADYPLNTKAFAAFLKLEENIRNSGVGEDEELVCYLPWTVYNSFLSSSEISKMIRIDDFNQGEASFKVRKINNITLIPVSDKKMYSAYDFFDGVSENETDGGFEKQENASLISMIMLPKKGASLVKKSEKIRIFTPEQNLVADAYKFDYRIYYDVFVKKSYLDSIWILK